MGKIPYSQLTYRNVQLFPPSHLLSSPFYSLPPINTVRMRVSAHCADAFLNVSFSGFYRTGVRRLRPVQRQRTLCGIRIKSFGTRFISAPLCEDSDLCDPDRNQSAVVGCFERTPLCEDCDLCDQNKSQPTEQLGGMTLCFAAGHGR